MRKPTNNKAVFVLNRKGFGQVMSGPDMQNALRDIGSGIVSAVDGQPEMVTRWSRRGGGERVRMRVYTDYGYEDALRLAQGAARGVER